MPTGPRPLTPNVAEVTMEFKQDGQYVYNKHHFKSDAGWDEGSLNNLGTAVREWWNTNIRSLCAMNLSLVAITCRDLEVRAGVQTAVTTGLPLAGTKDGVPLPNSVTAAVKKATGLSGRSYHGRTYHIGLVDNQITANTLTPLIVGLLRDKYTALIDPNGVLLPGQLCVLSEVTQGGWRAAGIASVVTGIAVDSTVDNQRRRLPGRGR